ncbi:MAG TPA: hypothetical protein VMR45_04015 [Patescibacteria group bacterium]|nr:hypothetical protein [Patescibacteria group bacterium]
MYEPEIGSNHNGNGHEGGVSVPLHVRTRSTDVPGRFVTPGSTMGEALTGTRIVDENQLNNILALDAWLFRWGVTSGQDKLIKKTNGLRSIGGYSIAAMLQAHTQIIVPEGLGVKAGSKSKRDLEEVKRRREGRNKDDEQARDDDR